MTLEETRCAASDSAIDVTRLHLAQWNADPKNHWNRDQDGQRNNPDDRPLKKLKTLISERHAEHAEEVCIINSTGHDEGGKTKDLPCRPQTGIVRYTRYFYNKILSKDDRPLDPPSPVSPAMIAEVAERARFMVDTESGDYVDFVQWLLQFINDTPGLADTIDKNMHCKVQEVCGEFLPNTYAAFAERTLSQVGDIILHTAQVYPLPLLQDPSLTYTFVSTSGIAFNNPDKDPGSQANVDAFFTTDTEGRLAWKPAGREDFRARVMNVYGRLFRCARMTGLKALVLIPMGLGVFFPDNCDNVANDMVLYYFIAQIFGALQALSDGWLDCVFLNPGRYATIATTVVDLAFGRGSSTDHARTTFEPALEKRLLIHQCDSRKLAVLLINTGTTGVGVLNPGDNKFKICNTIGGWENGVGEMYEGEEGLNANTTLGFTKQVKPDSVVVLASRKQLLDREPSPLVPACCTPPYTST